MVECIRTGTGRPLIGLSTGSGTHFSTGRQTLSCTFNDQRDATVAEANVTLVGALRFQNDGTEF